jgi:hypothetical protein
MQYLAEDSASVTGYFTLDEGRAILGSPFNYYLLTLSGEDNGHDIVDSAQVLDVVAENSRYTSCNFATLGLLAGRYEYIVYGQTSPTNTDIEDSSVVGIVERGILQLTNGSNIFVNGDQTINRDIEAI